MRKRVWKILAMVVLTSACGPEKATLITGWVSDESCGVLHTKPGGADCIRKCLRGGAHIGHPEWKPQRLVFVAEADKKVWIVENPEALRGREGERVSVSGAFDAGKDALRVNSVVPATD